MTKPATDTAPRSDTSRLPSPAMGSAVLIGAGFLVAAFLIAILPALTVAYLVVGFAVREVVVVLALWAASAAITVALFLAISRTYVRTMDRFQDLGPPSPGPSED